MAWVYALGSIVLLVLLIFLSVRDRNLASAEVVDGAIIVRPRGLNKVWTMKPKLVLPVDEVTDIRVDADPRRLPKGLRLPGTAVPGLILAGSYLKRGEWSFFAIRGGRPVVVIEASGRYRRVVFETNDPHGIVKRLNVTGLRGSDIRSDAGRETQPQL